MEKLRIQIDVDDVTAQFRKRFLEVANELFGWDRCVEECASTYNVENSMNLTRTQNSKIWVQLNKRGFAQSLDVMDGAGAVIDRLATKHEVFFVTSPLKSSETWVFDRTKWIRKHFGDTLARTAVFTKSKYIVDSDVLIEDNLDILRKWVDDRLDRCGDHREFYPVVYHWPYNAGALHFRRYVSWRIIGGAFGC